MQYAWYLSPKMAFKISAQEFPTIFLDIISNTNSLLVY